MVVVFGSQAEVPRGDPASGQGTHLGARIRVEGSAAILEVNDGTRLAPAGFANPEAIRWYCHLSA